MNCMIVPTMFWKSRKNTLRAENTSAIAIANVTRMHTPSSAGPDRGPGDVPAREQAGDHEQRAPAGSVWYAATSIEATGKISRGIRIFLTRALFCQIERVPPAQVSPK